MHTNVAREDAALLFIAVDEINIQSLAVLHFLTENSVVQYEEATTWRPPRRCHHVVFAVVICTLRGTVLSQLFPRGNMQGCFVIPFQSCRSDKSVGYNHCILLIPIL